MEKMRKKVRVYIEVEGEIKEDGDNFIISFPYDLSYLDKKNLSIKKERRV